MTDKEIIKALELAEKLKQAYADYYDMKKCMPYDIDTTLRESAICLENCTKEINRQQAELDDLKRDTIPKLQEGLKRANKYGLETDNENEQLKAEIERLNDLLKRHQRNTNRIRMITTETAKKIKAEAIKEFAERLKNLIRFSNQPDRYYIDNLVKEMVGEDK